VLSVRSSNRPQLRPSAPNTAFATSLEPAPTRGRHIPWSMFLKAHWKAMAASDFFTVLDPYFYK
jgi:hypothetical protein